MLSRETQTHPYVLKEQVLTALVTLPAALLPVCLALSAETGGSFKAYRILCHVHVA